MLIVQKFGGTSVGSLEKIKSSCNIVKTAVDRGYMPVVIVSAMAGKTDALIELYSQVVGNVKENEEMLAEKDVVVATGEQVCAGLFSAYLNSIGVKARSFNGWQAGILTDGKFTNAKIEGVFLNEVCLAIESGIIPIITGFQGYFLNGKRQTTLGRGGSDTSAIAIASALNASHCEIYKDVEGVLTGDPKIIENPKKILELSYNSMLEISSSGAKVLETRSVNFGAKYNVHIDVLSSFTESTGTKIRQVSEKAEIKSIILSQKEVFCDFSSKLSLNEELDRLNNLLVSYKIICIEGANFKILTQPQEAKKLDCEVRKASKISITGFFLKSDKVLERAVKVLEEQNLKPFFTSVSETKISIFLTEENVALAVKNLHNELTPNNIL
jgi:aspartate kinase